MYEQQMMRDERNSMTEQATVLETERSPTSCISVRKTGKSLYIEIEIDNKRCKALLDSGSEVTLIPAHQAKTDQIQRSNRKLKAANGTEINLIGEWNTSVGVGSLRLPVEFIVSDQIDEILIGIDWMRQNRCQLSFDSLTITIQGQRFPLLQKTTIHQCHRLVLQEAVELPGKSEMLVSGKVVYSNLRRNNPEVWLTETRRVCTWGMHRAIRDRSW